MAAQRVLARLVPLARTPARPRLLPRSIAASRLCRAGRLGACTRGSFGARRRSLLPQ
jgi:hypothetical protein